MQITKEQMEAIQEALRFYAEGQHYEWEGCHCHGQYLIHDRGERAQAALNQIEIILRDNQDAVDGVVEGSVNPQAT